MTSSNQSTYSLFLDQGHPFAADHDYSQHLRAHLIQGLLFQQKLIFGDTQLVRSKNFRHLLENEKDPFFTNYFTPHNFAVAIRRTENDTLEKIHKRQFETKYFDRKKPDYDPIFEETKGLNEIQNRAEVIYWDYNDIANGFVDRMQRFLLTEFSEQHSVQRGFFYSNLLNEIDEFNRTLDRFQETPKDVSTLGRDTFESHLWDFIGTKGYEFSPNERTFISNYSHATFKDNMPGYLKAGPLHDKSDTKLFEMLRGPKPKTEEAIEPLRLTLSVDASKYVAGLNALAPGDVEYLRSTAEFKTFMEKRNSFSGSQHDADELKNACESYLHKINDRILEQARFLIATDEAKAEAELSFRKLIWDSLPGATTGEVLGMYINFPFASFITTAIQIPIQYAAAKSARDYRNKELEKNRAKESEKANQELTAYLKRREYNATLDTDHIVSRSTMHLNRTESAARESDG